MTTGFQRDEIQDFIQKGEKSPPPVFVGREDILSDIETVARRSWQPGRAYGMPGSTRVLQGAPGSGKSSLLGELVSRNFSASRKGRDRGVREAGIKPRVLVFSSDSLIDNLPSVVAAIAAAGSMSSSQWTGHVGRFFNTLNFSIDVVGLSLAWTGSSVAPPVQFMDLPEVLPPKKWRTPVILAIDEAQRLDGGSDSPATRFLRRIHDASAGLPLALVVAGLGDTLDRIGRMGLTRPGRRHEIGALTAEQGQDLVFGFCHRFGLDVSGHRQRLFDLVAPAEGWPRHLHHALQALGAGAVAADGNLNRIDWKAVGTAAARARLHYYRTQRSAIMRGSHGLVSAVMRQLDDGMRDSDLETVIENAVQDRPGFRLPGGMDSSAFRQHLMHQGAIEMREDESYFAPIPSFRGFLVDRNPGLDPGSG